MGDVVWLEVKRLSRDEHVVKALLAHGLVAISDFLAGDAISRPRYRCQPLEADVLFAMKAGAVACVVKAQQRQAYTAQQRAVAVEIADRQFTLSGVLNFIESVRALLDFDAFAIYDNVSSSACFFSSVSLNLLSSCLVICSSPMLDYWSASLHPLDRFVLRRIPG